MDNKFTPGPWTFHPHSHLTLVSGRMSVASCNIRESNVNADELEEEKLANAHLISACPEMHRSLTIMTDLVRLKYGNLDKDVWEETLKAEKALAKAEGKDNGCGDEYLEITLADVQKHYAEKDNG